MMVEDNQQMASELGMRGPGLKEVWVTVPRLSPFLPWHPELTTLPRKLLSHIMPLRRTLPPHSLPTPTPHPSSPSTPSSSSPAHPQSPPGSPSTDPKAKN